MKENTIRGEAVRNPEVFLRPAALTRKDCEGAIAYVLKKIDENLETFTYKFPASASVGNVYPAVDNTDWTASFWTGMLWLAYEVTGDEKYRRTAEIQLESYRERVEKRIATDTHDLGFLYTLSCVAAWKLTGNESAKAAAVQAADLLMNRYFEKAGIIQAWGDLKDPANRGRMIIDCCMNLPLLYWASQVTGDRKYSDAARAHVTNAARYLVREDASTFHTFYMDVGSGEPKYGKTAQGYSDTSCWARGQAWGIYGFPLSYLYTGDWTLIETAKKVTDYFLNRLPADYVCYWDLVFTQGTEERDSSAAAIAACGLLEIARHLPLTDGAKPVYEGAAQHVIKSLIANYRTDGVPESNGILLHAVYGKPQHNGVDECNIWGDYYFFEALVRLTRDWKPYW